MRHFAGMFFRRTQPRPQPPVSGRAGATSSRHLSSTTPPRGLNHRAYLTTAGVALLLLNGCARLSQSVTTTVTTTNGTIETRESKATGWAFLDAKQSFEKLRVSNGKTQSIGLAGAEQETSTTNAAATLDALTRLLQSLPR